MNESQKIINAVGLMKVTKKDLCKMLGISFPTLNKKIKGELEWNSPEKLYIKTHF